MSLSRANGGGWSANGTLTSTQINTIDDNVSKALDKTVAGDTLSGVVTLSGVARLVPTCTDGADADTTYAVTTSNYIRVTSSVASNRTYTLSATGASTNDLLTIWLDSTATKNILVKDQASADLVTLGPSSPYSPWATFIYKGGWQLFASGSVTPPNRILATHFEDGDPIVGTATLTGSWAGLITTPPTFTGVATGDIIEVDITGYATIGTADTISQYAEVRASFDQGTPAYASKVQITCESKAMIPFTLSSRYTATSTATVTMNCYARLVGGGSLAVGGYVQSFRARHIRP